MGGVHLYSKLSYELAARRRTLNSRVSSNSPKTTVRDVAKAAKVSLGTVSHVLNKSAVVSDERRKAVLAAMKELDFQPSELARGLRSKSTRLLAMVIPDITNPFFPRVVRGAEDIAFEHGFRLVLCNSDNSISKEKAYLNEVRRFHPAGFLIIPAGQSRHYRDFSNLYKNTVFVDRCPDTWQGDSVSSDNESGGRLVAQYLLALGHRCIGVVRGSAEISNFSLRFKGFSEALSAAGISLSKKDIVTCGPIFQEGRVAGASLMARQDPPTAIFAFNNLTAAGVLAAAHDQGLKCPRDISIIGFDNAEPVQDQRAITSVDQDPYKVGSTACSILMSRIRAKDKDVERVLLPVRLNTGHSTQQLAVRRSSPSRRKL
jgi:DNA-binding LacI/PurR family transcriptional regulator